MFHVTYYQIVYRPYGHDCCSGRIVYGETTLSANSHNAAVYAVEVANPHCVVLCCIAA